MNVTQATEFSKVIDSLRCSMDAMILAFEATTSNFATLNRALSIIVAADIATLNDTQRAIYFAHQRAGLDHYEIMNHLF